MRLQKKTYLHYTTKGRFWKARKKEKMDSFIIYFSLIAIMYVLILPFVGKRARKKEETSMQPTFVFESWEVKAKHYDDVIKALDAMKG